MKMTLTRTDETLQVDGRYLRIWTGETEGGAPITALVDEFSLIERPTMNAPAKVVRLELRAGRQ